MRSAILRNHLNCFTVFMLATLVGGRRIIHRTFNFEALQVVAGVAGKRRAKFYLATLITQNGFHKFSFSLR